MLVIINPLQAVHAGSLGLLAAGSTQDLPVAVAEDLVGRGAARWVVSPPATIGMLDIPAAPVQSLVSEAGNITAAELLTTTGTTGQIVRLSDGENRGAILMWSTPEGASAESWCWWLWPQSAYEA